MDAGGNFDISIWPECVGYITELPGRQTWGSVVVCCITFKITAYLYQIYFPVASVSALKVIILVNLLSNA